MSTGDLTNIGSRIRKERRSKGLSQSVLSKNLGISASYLNLLESGRRTITVPLLIKIGNELSLSLKDLTVESNKRTTTCIICATKRKTYSRTTIFDSVVNIYFIIVKFVV